MKTLKEYLEVKIIKRTHVDIQGVPPEDLEDIKETIAEMTKKKITFDKIMNVVQGKLLSWIEDPDDADEAAEKLIDKVTSEYHKERKESEF